MTLDSEGGSGGTNQISVAKGDGFPAITTPVKDGYIFGGYYTSTNGGGTQYYTASGASAKDCDFTSATTLYAKWTPITYTIQYISNGGTGTMAASSHTYDVAKNLTANSFIRTGYTFQGWALTSTSGAVYTNSQSVINLTTTNGEIINLFAVWQPISVTLTFNNQSATTGGTTTMSVVYDAALSNITPPARTGYKFGGYYTQANGQGTQIFNEYGAPLLAKSAFTANTTLYARWITCSSITVTGSTTQITTRQVFDAEMVNATIMISPAAGHIVSEFSFDNTNWIPVTSVMQSVPNMEIASGVIYYASEGMNALTLEFKGLALNYGVIPIYLKTASGAYSGLKAAGGSVSGVVVTATLGGTAYIVGDDFENLEDSDTITISTTLCQPGYAFVGWYLDDDRTTAISTATSYRVAKSVAYEHTLVAVYQPTSNTNVNLEVDNT